MDPELSCAERVASAYAQVIENFTTPAPNLELLRTLEIGINSVGSWQEHRLTYVMNHLLLDPSGLSKLRFTWSEVGDFLRSHAAHEVLSNVVRLNPASSNLYPCSAEECVFRLTEQFQIWQRCLGKN